jgi:hypothetical protein
MELTLSFNGITKTLTQIEHEGRIVYDLNEIWNTWGLANKDRPRSWRGKEREAFEASTNLYTLEINHLHGTQVHTVATQVAVYAYAAWVSTEFYMAVFECFTAVANGQLEQAQAITARVTKAEAYEVLETSKRPLNKIRSWFDRFDGDVAEGVTEILDAISGCQTVTRSQRERFTASLTAAVNEWEEGQIHGGVRGVRLSGVMLEAETARLNIVKRERYWARRAASAAK